VVSMTKGSCQTAAHRKIMRTSAHPPILTQMTHRNRIGQYASGPGSTGVHRVFFTTDKNELLEA
jgi:hypothetical protein